MKKTRKDFSLLIVSILLIMLTVVGLAGWVAWDKNQSTKNPEHAVAKQKSKIGETASWGLVTTQGKAFTMKVPDGWTLTNYPQNYLGATKVIYKPGVRAAITTSNTDYMGHSLRFRASILPLDDAGLGPQWSSPQAGLDESTQSFSIGSLSGKRYKAIFYQDLKQMLYDYVFDLKNGKKLEIVYTIYPDEGEKDDVTTVEKAIKTIQFSQSNAPSNRRT